MNRPQTFSAFLFALGCAFLNGCGSAYLVLPAPVVSPVSVSFCSIKATHNVALQFATDGSGSARQNGTISLPAGLNASLVTTDAKGNLYVGGYTVNVNTAEVVVYAAGATGSASPARIVLLGSGKLTAPAVSSSGQIYAGQLNVSGFGQGLLRDSQWGIDRLANDSGGNFYMPVAMGNASAGTHPATLNIVYGLAAGAGVSASPMVQFKATDATTSSPLGTHIPLGVFRSTGRLISITA